MATETDALDGQVLRLTYTSAVTRLLSVSQLVDLIEQIRPKNERLGVTGLLLYSGGNVIQTIEGEPGTVESLFGAIEGDPRHSDVRIVERLSEQDRAFSSWSMAFRNVSAREVAQLRDFAEFARQSVGRDLGLHAEPSFRLLEKFRVNTV